MSNPLRITVVTPSYNQAAYIEKTICSVLDQCYPNLEYFVVDGGSTDGAVDIITRYADRLDWWVTEKDRGQSHAINKGFARATGDVLCWLNSDDYFSSNTLAKVAEVFSDPNIDALCGHHVRVNPDGTETFLEGHYRGRKHLLQYWHNYQMHQASIFWRKQVYEKVGALREDMNLIMDYDYWLRIARDHQFHNVNAVLSFSHYHLQAKTGDGYAGYHRGKREHALTVWEQEPIFERILLKSSRVLAAIQRAMKTHY